MAEGANVTVSVYVPEHVRKALEAEVRAPPHEKGAGEGKRASLRSYLRDLLARLISEEADGGLLPHERRMISYASREYSVPVDLPKEAYVRLRERASRAGESVNVLASALLLNYSLRDPYVRREHASFFPQSAETARFVKDGDKSHLIRAYKRAGGGGAVNYVALGRIFYDSFLGLVADEEEMKGVASLGSEELKAEVKGYVKRLKQLVDDGLKEPELRRENEELRAEVQRLRAENGKLREGVQSRDRELKELRARKEELEKSSAQLGEQLKAQRERAQELEKDMNEYEDAVSLVMTARNDPLIEGKPSTAAEEVSNALKKGNFSIRRVDRGALAHYIALVILVHYARYLLRQDESPIASLVKLPTSQPCLLRASDRNLMERADDLVSEMMMDCSLWGNYAKEGEDLSPVLYGPEAAMLSQALNDMASKVLAVNDMLDRCKLLFRLMKRCMDEPGKSQRSRKDAVARHAAESASKALSQEVTKRASRRQVTYFAASTPPSAEAASHIRYRELLGAPEKL
jgi:hypothetical protein